MEVGRITGGCGGVESGGVERGGGQNHWRMWRCSEWGRCELLEDVNVLSVNLSRLTGGCGYEGTCQSGWSCCSGWSWHFQNFPGWEAPPWARGKTQVPQVEDRVKVKVKTRCKQDMLNVVV